MVNGIDSLISLSDFSLLVYRNASDFCVFYLLTSRKGRWERGWRLSSITSHQAGDGKTEPQILGVDELKWTEMSKFNSDDRYIYYCGQESLKRNRVAYIVNKREQNEVLECNLKNDRDWFISKANHSTSQ